jgi:transposase, IS5 family
MYQKRPNQEISPKTFEIPVERTLDENNRWVLMAKLLPWEEFEEEYASIFSEEMGAPAKSFRMALGALIIKEKLGITDRETVEQIRENPYLQYFIGLNKYSNEIPFDPSLMVKFRERIPIETINKINREMVKKNREERGEYPEEITNKGQLIADASCCPADISYPTDLKLLNQGRKETEKIIDLLHDQRKGKLKKKPRTSRKNARKEYLEVAKKRKPSKEKIQEGIKKQLKYLKRNLEIIDQLIREGANLSVLSKRQYKILLVVSELYRQQQIMNQENLRTIDDRIVSINQPHVRPIMRGKAGADTEFGSKISVSCFDSFVFLDHLSWDNFNESQDLIKQIEDYKEYTGFYPASVHVDQIYRTRKNRKYCQERGIRMSGKPLGRPPENVSQESKKQAREDEKIRNQIEGKFGNAKRRYGLNRVMARLSHTSETAIAITFLVMNLSTLLRQVMGLFLSFFGKKLHLAICDDNNLSFSYKRQDKLILI